MTTTGQGLTYSSSGVDIDAGNRLVDLIKPMVRATARRGADAEIGGFGGLFDLKAAGFADPVLVAATDIPLYALLRHMHAHVTHSSSTVLESREFGMPSVVTSAYGVEFFHSQVDDAYLAPAFDAAAIGAAVRRLLTAGPPAGASASVPNQCAADGN